MLDALDELLREHPWAEVTMAAVAERAGVSRQTLYNEFGSRGELAQEYLTREARGFLEAVERAVGANAADPRAALTAALEAFLSEAASHPVVRAVSGADQGDDLLALVTTRGGPLLGEATARLARLLTATWPAVSADDARLIAETLVRLAISHATLPSGPPEQTSAATARMLGPLFDELLADGEADRATVEAGAVQ